MTIVDTHVHTSSDWYEPIEVILFQMKRNGVDKATLVQSRQLYRGHPDNRYLIECARRFPGQFSPIVMLDTERADAGDVLKQWVKRGAGGVRLTPTTRSPGNDPLAIWRTCAELNLPVSCQGKEAEFATDEFSRLVKALPDVPIIIEHLGFVNREEEATPYATYRKLLSLADYPNTYIKVPGLGEICPRAFLYHIPFPFDSIPPFIKMAYEAFGPPANDVGQ